MIRAMLGSLLRSLRPYQWVKNVLVFAPLVFAHKLGDQNAMIQAVIAFFAFSLLSSTIYVINDTVDREADAKHPVKCHRPIASGAVSVPAAIALAILCVTLSAIGTILVTRLHPNPAGTPFWIWPLTYGLFNLGYSFGLKKKVIIDCLIIALGFQFRVLAGSAAIDVAPSKWILLCTFFFALFLAFCKRREELSRTSSDGSTRATMLSYTLPFLDQIIAPLAALSILTYALYAVDAETIAYHGTDNLLFTVPFVVFGVFRYLFLVHGKGGGEDPTKLLFKDKQILLSGVLWASAVLAIVGFA